jgi:3-hydroxyacyl-CoA dehydrogenase / enoyl-CoA hydratase / 3-hydroxybutyryl-CoA epimerase
MTMITKSMLDGGITCLTIDTGGAVNTMSAAFNAEFASVVNVVLGDVDVKGIVITSAKDGFVAGGNLDQLRAAKTPEAVAAIVDPFNAALRKLETGGKPVVAALNGTTLGGGCELAMGCHRRIAADRPDAQFGQPEVGLGLMPGAGGTQRLPRMVGLEKAAELVLTGKPLNAQAALEAGLVDELVPAENLLERASEWARTAGDVQQPWDRRGFTPPGLDPNSRKGRFWFASAWATMRQRSAGTDAAATAILYCLHHGLERKIDPALAIERRQFMALASGEAAKNKIRTLFYAARAARPKADKSLTIGTIGVVGGGTMGNGIAFASAKAGHDLVLIDISEEKAVESIERIGAIAARQVKRGRMSQEKADSLMARISAGADYQALSKVDFVIEAVFERTDLKHEVLKRIEAATRADVPIASNTSTLPIGGLASVLEDPSRMIGMHFFAPVEVMKLLEIIHTDKTSDAVKSAAQTIAAALRKQVIVVNDGLGFYTSRIVTSMSSEGMTLVAEGVAPQVIDNVMVRNGFAIGAATLAELTKLPLLKDIMVSMSGEGTPVCMTGARGIEALDLLIDAGREGKLTGKGLYDYEDGKPRIWPGLAELFPSNTEVTEEEAEARLLVTQSLEAVRALEDGTVTDPLTADMAAVTGWGYPVHLGGPFAYIDTVGTIEFVARCDALANRFGTRFAVPEKLRAMAAVGERFHTL